MAQWKEMGHELFPISVNLSKLHFFNDALVEDILSQVRKFDIDPRFIELEVTETVFNAQTDLLSQKLEELRGYGFRVSVDDFGAGYSSLNIIGTLPVDIIKLDKGFVHSSLKTSKGQEIVKGLIEILNRIDLRIICEGVEDRASEKMISSYGCDEIQGYLYDRPLQVDQFARKYLAS